MLEFLEAIFVLRKITQPPKLAEITTQIVPTNCPKREPPVRVIIVATGIDRLTIEKYISENIRVEISKFSPTYSFK